MKNNSTLIAGRDEMSDGYSRLQMLMDGNEEEHRRQERIWVVILIIACILVFQAGLKIRQDTDNMKADAAAVIDRYVQQTYGDEFDKFQVSDNIGTYTYNGEITLIYRYYEDPAWPGSNFSIAADTQGNIARDGYQTNYLKGAVIFRSCSNSYREQDIGLSTKFRVAAIEHQLVTNLDNLYLRVDFSRKDDPYSHNQYAFDSNGIYTGPVLDLENPPTLDQLADEFDCVHLEIDMAKGTLQGYRDIILLLPDFMADNGIHFNLVKIRINSKSDIGNIHRLQFTAEEMTGSSFETILTDRLAAVIAD